MKILSKKSSLSGEITVPGSKSHTIRALLFSSIAEGTSHIKNPLPGADCISSSQAVKLFGAKVDISNNSEWIVEGAGKNAHLPSKTRPAPRQCTCPAWRLLPKPGPFS